MKYTNFMLNKKKLLKIEINLAEQCVFHEKN